jgi:putative transposase
MEELKRSYREWVEESLARQSGKRESRWTESIANGSKAFVEKTKAELGIKAIGREVMAADGVYELREHDISYNPNFAGENSGLRLENSYFWNLSI